MNKEKRHRLLSVVICSAMPLLAAAVIILSSPESEVVILFKNIFVSISLLLLAALKFLATSTFIIMVTALPFLMGHAIYRFKSAIAKGKLDVICGIAAAISTTIILFLVIDASMLTQRYFGLHLLFLAVAGAPFIQKKSQESGIFPTPLWSVCVFIALFVCGIAQTLYINDVRNAMIVKQYAIDPAAASQQQREEAMAIIMKYKYHSDYRIWLLEEADKDVDVGKGTAMFYHDIAELEFGCRYDEGKIIKRTRTYTTRITDSLQRAACQRVLQKSGQVR